MREAVKDAGVLWIGTFLKQRREYLGMSREKLASKIGTTYNTIRLYEEGKRIMRLDRLCEILDALGLRPLDSFSSKLRDDIVVAPETLHLAQRLETLDKSVYSTLLRQIHALIDVAET